MRLPPSGDQEEFYANLLKSCRSEAENACIMLLWRTGMHASTLVNRDFRLVRADHTEIEWVRPKTGKRLRATLPPGDGRTIAICVIAGSLPSTVRTLERWVRRIGERAGYPGICPLTLRHSRAIWLMDAGLPVNRVSSLMGCSYEVLEKHYAQIEAARLIEHD